MASDTLYLVRDPSGKAYACSVISHDDARENAFLRWEYSDEDTIPHGVLTKVFPANGYTVETITVPSAHDAAIVAAAEAHINAGILYEQLLPPLETLDWTGVESNTKAAFDRCMAARNSLRAAVQAKREAQG